MPPPDPSPAQPSDLRGAPEAPIPPLSRLIAGGVAAACTGAAAFMAALALLMTERPHPLAALAALPVFALIGGVISLAGAMLAFHVLGHRRSSLATAPFAGAAIAGAPWAFLALLNLPLALDGYGLLESTLIVLMLSLPSGALAGLAFWRVVYRPRSTRVKGSGATNT